MASNGNSPTVIGNPIKEITSNDIQNGDLSLLFVSNGDSYNEKELVRMASTDTSIKLQCSDSINAILKNTQFPNNYTVLIPHLKSEASTDVYPKLTDAGHRDIIASLPDLTKINAQTILITSGTNEPKVWKISYTYDGKFAIQEAIFCGIEFIRWAVNGQNWGAWSFKNDQNLIGTLRLDYIDKHNVTEFTQFKNRMGWISTDTVISLNQYPRLYRHIEKNWTNGNNSNQGAVSKGSYFKDATGGINIYSEAGLYPRFIGNGFLKGVQTNPDIAGCICSDNVDYANKSQSWSGNFYHYYRDFIDEAFGVFTKRTRFGQEYFGSSISRDSMSPGVNMYFSYGNSNNETRVKSKFFSLMIYAGYPIQ